MTKKLKRESPYRRKINGKIYIKDFFSTGKVEAKEQARNLRKIGYNARVFPGTSFSGQGNFWTGYTVYKRKK